MGRGRRSDSKGWCNVTKDQDPRTAYLDRLTKAHDFCRNAIGARRVFFKALFRSFDPPPAKSPGEFMDGIATSLPILVTDEDATELFDATHLVIKVMLAGFEAFVEYRDAFAEVSTILTDDTENHENSYHHHSAYRLLDTVGVFLTLVPKIDDPDTESYWRSHNKETLVLAHHYGGRSASVTMTIDLKPLYKNVGFDEIDANQCIHGRLWAQLRAEYTRARRLLWRDGVIPDAHGRRDNEPSRLYDERKKRIVEALEFFERAGNKKPKTHSVLRKARVRDTDGRKIMHDIESDKGSKPQAENS